MHVHVLAPLDPDHDAAATALARSAAGAAGLDPAAVPGQHHLSLVVAVAVDRPRLERALAALAGATPPLLVRAHGYGVFCDREPAGNSLHVPVVRTPALEALRRGVEGAVRAGGGEPAGWTDAEHWSPHVTLLDHDLTPARLAAAVAHLAARHHPSWVVRLERLVVAPPQGSDEATTAFPLAGAAGPGPQAP